MAETGNRKTANEGVIMAETKTETKAKPKAVKTLARRLLDIQAEVEKLKKDGQNAHFKYGFVSEMNVVDSVRELFQKHGVLVLPSLINSWTEQRGKQTEKGPRTDFHSFALVKYTLEDVETGETKEVEWLGEGLDSGDKGFYKAYSGSQKYFLMKTLMIPTGDDPENDNGKQKTAGKPQAADKREQSSDTTINEKQVNLLHIWFRIAGVSDDWKQRVIDSFGVDSWTEITKAQMDAVKERLVKDGALDFDGDGIAYDPRENKDLPEESLVR